MSFYGWDPACETAPDELAERERIAGELTGADIWEAMAWDEKLGQKAEGLFLLATVLKDDAELGRLLRLIVDEAVERAVDGKARDVYDLSRAMDGGE